MSTATPTEAELAKAREPREQGYHIVSEHEATWGFVHEGIDSTEARQSLADDIASALATQRQTYEAEIERLKRPIIEWQVARAATLAEEKADVRFSSTFKACLDRLANAEAVLAALAPQQGSDKP